MAICSKDLLSWSEAEDDTLASAILAHAAATCAVGETIAYELRLLGIGTPQGLGAIEDLARHMGERLAELIEVLRCGLDELAAAQHPGE